MKPALDQVTGNTGKHHFGCHQDHRGGCNVLSRDLSEKLGTNQQKIKLGQVFMKKHQGTNTDGIL